jgi:carbon-monoxide dehydrogenase large subunit
MMASGTAILGASEKVVEKGKQIAAHVLEAAVADIEFARGRFVIAGTDRSIGIMELAAQLQARARAARRRAATSTCSISMTGRPRPFRTAAHRRGRDRPETGVVEVVKYSMVNDFGVIVNPLLVEGQAHGGIVQGIGQALMERCVRRDGQFLTGSFMDYAMPRADDAPMSSRSTATRCRPRPIRSAPRAAARPAAPARCRR